MSLVSCDLDWEEDARIMQTSREWRAFYKVLMSHVDDGPREMLTALPKLNPYAPHPKDSFALVAEFWPQRIRGTNFWDLQVRYSTDVDVALNPLRAPAVIEIDSVTRTIPALFDADGNPIVNVVGDFYTDPPVERNITDLVIKIQKNVPLVLPDWPFLYPDTVNADAVKIRGRTFPKGTLYFGAVRIGPEQNVPGSTDSVSTLVKGTPYTTIEFELNYRRQGWTILLPNWGYFQLVPTSSNARKADTSGLQIAPKRAKKIRVKQFRKGFVRQRITIGPIGDYPAHPVFLDENGTAIANPTFDDIITIEADLVPAVQFNGQIPLR